MRATTVLPACLFGASILFCSGFLSAFALVSKPAPQHLSNLQSPDLWPADVRRVRAAGQGGKPAMAVTTEAARTEETGATPPRLSVTIEAEPIPATEARDSGSIAGSSAHESWCKSRYRSYRSSDNTYTSYGGSRKDCISPMADLVVEASLDGGEPQGLAEAVSDDDSGVARCRARYASYRASDNTYQPFSGPRRLCTLGGL